MKHVIIASIFAVGVATVACTISSNVTREVGARCDTKYDCSELCLPDGSQFPGGFCSVSCQSGQDCPSDTACAKEMLGVCLFECVQDNDCAYLGVGWRCQNTDSLPEGEVMVCIGED